MCLTCHTRNQGPLCDKCADYARHYIERVWSALQGGVFLDRGTIKNITIYERYLERREAWLAASRGNRAHD